MALEKSTDNKTRQPSVKQNRKPAATSPAVASPAADIVASQHAVSRPGEASPAQIQSLQRSYGNQAVQGLVQTKLTVGATGDRYEQEADQTASRVMSMTSPSAASGAQRDQGGGDAALQTELVGDVQAIPGERLQMNGAAHQAGCACPACGGQAVQRHSIGDEIHRMPDSVTRPASLAGVSPAASASDVQRRADLTGSFEPGGAFENRLASRGGAGAPLSSRVRSFMEPRFGADFSGVRVHADKESAGLNRQIHADAFTHGQNIFLGAGKNNPETSGGIRLLAHELTHVVQQTGSSVRPKRAGTGTGTAQRVHKAPGRIQRHSSWEHKALGDVNPDKLQIIGTYQELAEANKRAKKAAGMFGKVAPGAVAVDVAVGAPNDPPLHVTLEDFLHVIGTEIDRLKTFRDHPPTEASETAEREMDKRAKIRSVRKELQAEFGKTQYRQKTKENYQLKFDSKMSGLQAQGDVWQVKLLAITHRDATTGEETGEQTIITYGEMNTLGDFVGNPSQLELIPKKNLWGIIQGIRQQSMIRFMRLRDQVKGKSTQNKMYWGQGFSDTAGSTGRGPLGDEGKLGSETVGQLRLMMADKSGIKGADGKAKAETNYTTGLARNACHFAPESWITWEKFHREAIQFAKTAVHMKGMAGRATGRGDQAGGQSLTEQAEEWKRKAVVSNGYGDHFLQDSFAAGHLINKDEIMKWYAQWLANDPTWNATIAQQSASNDTTQGGANKSPDLAGGADVTAKGGIGGWRRWDYQTSNSAKKNVSIAQQQSGLGVEASRYDTANLGPGQQPKNMEGVEGMGGDWEGRFAALGLKLPNSLKQGTASNRVFKGWQKLVAQNNKYTKITPGEFVTAHGITGPAVSVVGNAFAQFAKDSVAYTSGKRFRGENKGETIYELRKTYRLTGTRTMADKVHGRVSNPTDVSGADYEQRAKKGVYKDYHKYMNTAVLQASTNILHDHFCANGLYVQSAGGTNIGKIYGDDAMFKKESAKGLKFVGDTSNMSRDSIYDMADANPALGVPTEPVGKTTTDIKNRFPTHVTMADGTGSMSLDNWHTSGPLKLLCEKKIFPAANRHFFKTFIGGTVGSKFGLGGAGLSDKISKDVTVHKGEAF